MLSSSLSLSSSLMHRVARNPAAGARGPAGADVLICVLLCLYVVCVLLNSCLFVFLFRCV